jgi:hypothetical protein
MAKTNENKYKTSIENLERWVATFKFYARTVLLVSKTISPALKAHLQQIADKDVDDFRKEVALNFL